MPRFCLLYPPSMLRDDIKRPLVSRLLLSDRYAYKAVYLASNVFVTQHLNMDDDNSIYWSSNFSLPVFRSIQCCTTLAPHPGQSWQLRERCTRLHVQYDRHRRNTSALLFRSLFAKGEGRDVIIRVKDAKKQRKGVNGNNANKESLLGKQIHKTCAMRCDDAQKGTKADKRKPKEGKKRVTCCDAI